MNATDMFAQHLESFSAMMQAARPDYPQREDFEGAIVPGLECIHQIAMDAWCPDCVEKI